MAKDDLVREELPFEVPKFNEDEFVRKELISFRTTAIMFVYSLLMAVVTFFFWKYAWGGADLTASQYFVLIVFCLGTGALLPFLYRALGVDIRHFRRKEWAGTVFMHFLFWMGFSLLLANPPLSDTAAPVIEAYATPAVQGLGGIVTFGAYIGDNAGLDEGSLQFCLRNQTAGECDTTAWTRVDGQPVWTREWTPTAEGVYGFTISVKDDGGRTTLFNGSVVIGNPFPRISPVNGATFEDDSRRVSVRPHEGLNLRAVMYEINDRVYNMTPPAEKGGEWQTDPTYPGWHAGDVNVTFLAQEQPRYLHGYKLGGGKAGGIAQHAGAVRSYKVAADFQDLNFEKEPSLAEVPAPNLVGTPGFEAPFLLAALGLVAIVGIRRRRHDRA